jgi:hypothetical protein
VNVDVDVPLFMPLYGQRRLHDLRRIAGREIKENFRIDGQMNFDSGWEWGYWLSDVVGVYLHDIIYVWVYYVVLMYFI